MSGLTWVRSPASLAERVEEYGRRVTAAVTAVAQYVAAEMQNEAKATASWTDRTGNARSGLFGTAEASFAESVVTIYLSHGATIDYGVYLELAHAGRYAVIMRTMEGKLGELQSMLDGIFR